MLSRNMHSRHPCCIFQRENRQKHRLGIISGKRSISYKLYKIVFLQFERILENFS